MTSDRIERGTSKPVYVQIADIFRRRIREGEIPPGYPLPSKRALRQEFGAADGTVGKAMAILREEGLAQTVRGLGVFATQPSQWRAPP